MENKQNKLVFLAESVSISEQSKLNPIFLTIDVKLCDSKLNQNREGTTAAFIEDVVTRQTDHMCLPFYADVKNLLAGNFDQLGHLYDRVKKTFGTNMIGSISEFYSATDDDGVVSLYGTIKVPKRDRDIIFRLVDLYEMGRFAVSVELSYDPRELVLKDGGKFIDVSENSALTGLCLVWSPACEDAYAMSMVAERVADDSEIVAECEKQTSDRGETDLKDKEEMTAEVTETAEDNKETVVAEEENPKTKAVVIAEGEGASDSDIGSEAGASDSDSGSEAGASDSGSGGSDSGAGGSDGEGGGGGDDESEDTTGPVVDPSEEEPKRVNAGVEQANAEVLEHSVDTHESVMNYGGDPVHVVEVTERVIETIEQANTVIAEKDQKIKELENQIAELKQIEEKYNAIVAEEEAKVLAQKQEKARVFAEKQGLDMNETAVAEAVKALDFAKIAELTMAQVQDEEEPEQKEEPVQKITLASFVELDVGDNNSYGGLLKPRNK